MGWNGIKNGRLLALAAGAGFDAMLTTDKSIEHQQNRANLPLAVIVLDVPSNDLPHLLPLVPSLLAVLANLAPKSVSRVP